MATRESTTTTTALVSIPGPKYLVTSTPQILQQTFNCFTLLARVNQGYNQGYKDN